MVLLKLILLYFKIGKLFLWICKNLELFVVRGILWMVIFVLLLLFEDLVWILGNVWNILVVEWGVSLRILFLLNVFIEILVFCIVVLFGVVVIIICLNFFFDFVLVLVVDDFCVIIEFEKVV